MYYNIMYTGYLNQFNISQYPLDISLKNLYSLNIENNNSQVKKDDTLYPLTEEQQYKILYDITQVKLKPPVIGQNLLPKVPVKIIPPKYKETPTGTYQTVTDENIDMIPDATSVGTTAQNSSYDPNLSITANKYKLTLENFNNSSKIIIHNFNNLSCKHYDMIYILIFIVFIIIMIVKNILNKKI